MRLRRILEEGKEKKRVRKLTDSEEETPAPKMSKKPVPPQLELKLS